SSNHAPTLSLRISGGKVEVVWDKDGVEDVEIQVDRGTRRSRHLRKFASLPEAYIENGVSRVYLGVLWRFDSHLQTATGVPIIAPPNDPQFIGGPPRSKSRREHLGKHRLAPRPETANSPPIDFQTLEINPFSFGKSHLLSTSKPIRPSMKTLIAAITMLPLALQADIIPIPTDPTKENETKLYDNKSGELGKKVNIVPLKEDYNLPWDKEFGKRHPYSSALGFTLWKSENTHLGEVSVAPMLTKEEYTKDIRENLRSYIGNLKYDAMSAEQREAKVKELSDRVYTVDVDPKGAHVNQFNADQYKDRQLTSRLGIYNNQTGAERGSAVLFSIRNTFSNYNLNQEGLAFDYTNTDGKGSMKLKGALMADIYLDTLYNGKWRDEPWYIQNPYRISLRTGVEFDQDDTIAKKSDRTSFYLLTNFQANPDQNAHLFGSELAPQITSPQFVQIGVALDHDELTGDDDLRWILDWQPRFYLIKDDDVIAQSLGIGQGFAINHIMNYKAGEFLRFAKNQDEEAGNKPNFTEKEISPWYSYIPADIKLTGGSEIWDELAKGEGDLDKASVNWQLGLILGHSDYHFRCGYKAEGVSPLTAIGDSHIGHTLFVEKGFGLLSPTYDQKQRAYHGKGAPVMTGITSSDIGPVTIFAKYTFGEFEPTFENQEIFQIGTRVRF
ncbi:MAG: hypothetical protein ABIT37_25035, partial [Luteolibacter sp.]